MLPLQTNAASPIVGPDQYNSCQSKALMSFIRESTLPRIISSLASIRSIVGMESPDFLASSRWSIWASARAARNWAAVIMAGTRHIQLP